MKYYCDLHIHSTLSPCGDDDMTPNNIVNMASLCGLDIIAVCDHNSIGNVKATMEVAKDTPLCVVAGMELETSEEVHFLCLFEDYETAVLFDDWLSPYKPKIKNEPKIFGTQCYLDENDELLGYEENLLVTACSVSIYDVKKKIDALPAVILPAHIDRASYSIISNLGFIPDDLQFSAVEISSSMTKEEACEKFSYIKKYNIITNSDAHYLGNIYEHQNPIELSAPTAKELVRALKYTCK